MADKDDLSGRKIGDFVLRERIGEGGFGAVYSCDQPLLRREAVIKVLHRRLRGREIIVQRFLREAQLASRLDHPYAAHVYAFGIEEHDKLLWIAMERVHGITLAEWLKTHGPMPLTQFVPFFEHIASVVQTAHEQGILHRDLKPANVMVIERAGELFPKLLDFGVAKALDDTVPVDSMPGIQDLLVPFANDSGEGPIRRTPPSGPTTVTGTASQRGEPDRLTQQNFTVGSPAYISPEQWTSVGEIGPASDLYALAVVAFESLTGRLPFETETMEQYAELHRFGKVPALGGDLPEALDPMFQRALAKRSENRWNTALELAAALRAASGIGASSADLPRIDATVRDAWLVSAPQPLAELVAVLNGARNAHQAHIATQELVRNVLRYLVAVALAAYAQAREGHDDPALLEVVRALDRRELSTEERVRLLRLLVRAPAERGLEHPLPELMALVTPGSDGADALVPILTLHSMADHAVTEDAAQVQLMRLMPELTRLLQQIAFVLDYTLVVPHKQAAERWTGRRSPQRTIVEVSDGKLVDGHPTLLDRSGRVCLDLWPLAQVAPPTHGADAELFLFDGYGHHGSLMIAAPSRVEQNDAVARKWVARHIIAAIEDKTRMREHLRIAARQWQDRLRSETLLWRGEVLVELERWTRHTSAPNLSDVETSFIAASRCAARRSRWTRRALVALAVAAVIGGVKYQAVVETRAARQQALVETRAAQQQARMTQQFADLSVTQAEAEEGRQALLHDESAEALLHLSEAYRRGDHSPATTFMLARAQQPRIAEQARFQAASGRMRSATFSPNGHQIVTADDTCAQVWDARTHQLLFKLPHGDTVYDVRYTADGARIVTAGGDGTVRIWDAATGTTLRVLTWQRRDGKSSRYYYVALSPDEKLVGAIDMMGAVVHVWNTSKGAPLAELRNEALEFPSLAFSHDGRWLATSGGGDAYVFDTTTWARVLVLTGPSIRSLSFDPTRPRLASGTLGGDASIWDIPGGARIRHLREVGESVDRLAFAPSGKLLATASGDGAEQIWDTTSGVLQNQFNTLRSKIQSIEFDRTSKLVLAASVTGAVAVTDAELGMPVAMLEGPSGGIRVAHFDATSQRVVGASVDGTARLWDATSPYRRWSSPRLASDCGLGPSADADRRFVAVGCRGHSTLVWDTARDQLLAELPAVTPVPGDFLSASPAVSARGDRAAIARGNAVEVYELPAGRLLRTIQHDAPVNAVAFAFNGDDLVSGATSGSLVVTRDGREPIALPSSGAGIDTAAILPDGRVVATDARRRLRTYDATDHGNVLAEFELPARVGFLLSSPDGRRLITIPSYTGTLGPPVLWDMVRYRMLARLAAHTGRVFSARFVSGGSAIVTAGADGTARMWNSESGELRQTYRGSPRFLGDVALTPDGAFVVAGGGDGLLRFWDAASGRQLWKLQAHRSSVIGIHVDGDDIVTRGQAGEISRWTLPRSARIIEAASTK